MDVEVTLDLKKNTKQNEIVKQLIFHITTTHRCVYNELKSQKETHKLMKM